MLLEWYIQGQSSILVWVTLCADCIGEDQNVCRIGACTAFKCVFPSNDHISQRTRKNDDQKCKRKNEGQQSNRSLAGTAFCTE